MYNFLYKSFTSVAHIQKEFYLCTMVKVLNEVLNLMINYKNNNFNRILPSKGFELSILSKEGCTFYTNKYVFKFQSRFTSNVEKKWYNFMFGLK